jgi:hypothetical protein
MRTLVIVALLAACTPTETESRHVRWPKHRQMHDDRLDKLEKEILALQQHVTKLENDLRAVRTPP